MKLEHNVEITDPEFLLLLEINQRVKYALSRINDGREMEITDLKCLKIDKGSIALKHVSSPRKIIARNLIDKINYIIETQGEKD